MPEHLGLPLHGQEMERHSELEVKSPHLDTLVTGKSISPGTPPQTDLRQGEDSFHLSSLGQTRALFQFLYFLLGEAVTQRVQPVHVEIMR